jgi:simple sugar transport system ATP-binding protein
MVEMKGITKHFPGVIANDNVDFEVKVGEIHCLLGENGAGKTTLMNILYGFYAPNAGEIVIKGEKVVVDSPIDAIRLGIGMVFQHFMLVKTLTVAENVVLGLRSNKWPLLDIETAEKRIEELTEKYGLKVEPKTKIWQLSVGEQQRVEILKALYRDVEILILDEPTSVLTPQEATQLFQFLKSMKSEGRSVVFITHKLNEVMEVSDRVTVLKNGTVTGTVNTSETSKSDLARMMIGRDVLFECDKPQIGAKDSILSLSDVWAMGDKEQFALKGISLEIEEASILGIAGVAGNGQRELVEVITGLRTASRGSINLGGEEITNKSPRDIRDLGVGHITEDRMGRGLVLSLSIEENAILGAHHSSPLTDEQGFLLDSDAIRNYTENLIADFDIKTPSRLVPAESLSGGNLQKLILARELSRNPRVLVAASPTKGLDVGATEFIRNKIIEQQEKGIAVLLISEDLDEIFDLSDDIAVMYEGSIVGKIKCSETTYEQVGLMMTGVLEESSN